MSDFNITAQGDLQLIGHQINLVSGTDAIAQQIQIRCKFFLGEFFLNQQLGIPYYREILIKNPNLAVIRDIFRQAIEGVPGIDRVVDLDATIDNATRTLRLSFSAILDTDEELVFEPFIIEI